MTADIVLVRSVFTRMRPVLALLLTLSFAGCGATDPGPEFTAPGAAAAGGTTQTPTAPVTATPVGTVPAVPGGLMAAAGNAQVMLSWSASTGATAYNVSRSVMSGGPWTPVAQPTTNAFTDTGLTNGVPYYYVVAALNSAGASANSNQVTATPTTPGTGVIMRAPPVPSGLQATPGNTQVMLTWMVSTGATSYQVSRSTQSSGPWIQVATPTTNSYTDKGLTNGTVYYYVVAAVSAAGTSANSAPVSATPAAPPVVGTGVGAGYWHTSGNRILDSNGTPVRIAGINWYGFETKDHLAHGLYAQDYKTILNIIKSLGYNVIRIPFSNELVESNPVPTNFTTNAGGLAANTALIGQTALTDLDTIVSYAGSIGLRIILDNHRSEAGNSNEASGLWYTSAYPQANWLADWQTLATRYSSPKFTFNGNPTVIGVDLRNEPHLIGATRTSGSCWTGDTATNGCPTSLTAQNWPVAAEAAGNAVLAINPKLLVFVEGNDCYNNVCGWQGGNLLGVATNPVVLNVPNQLVYSAHDYGPALFRQPWFNATTTANSLYAVWNQFWGYISAAGTAPVWLSEFGTTNSRDDIESPFPGSQGQWFQSLVSYLQSNPSIDWTYWALNGEDNYGLLDAQYDATPVSALKQSLLQTLQFPLTGGT